MLEGMRVFGSLTLSVKEMVSIEKRGRRWGHFTKAVSTAVILDETLMCCWQRDKAPTHST